MKNMKAMFVFLVCILLTVVDCSEPICSKFDHQEQLLEKMIRTEIKVETMEKSVKTTQTEMMNVLNFLKTDINSELNKTQNEIKDQIKTLSGEMKMFEDDIISTLKQHGIENIEIKMVYSPAWTTDWMTKEAKEKLKEYGIAPPVDGSADKGVLFANGPKVVICPRCNSKNTTLKSQFGSTACKALYVCNDCLEPFDYFKCI